MKNIKIIYFVLIFTLLLTACGGETTSPVNEDSGNETASNDDLIIDPAHSSADLAGYLYEGLVKNVDGTITPALAESYTVSEDGLDYIFNLRPGVTFHDGLTLSADVVVANFNRWFDPNDPNRGSGNFAAWVENFGGFKGELNEEGKSKSQYDGIEKVDTLTVLIHLNTPDPDFVLKLTNPAFSMVNNNSGTGIYKIASNDGTTITLEPFTGYWDPSVIPTENMTIPVP